MRLRRLAFALCLFAAATAGAQTLSTVVVPVVGSTFGPTMIRWMTDVELVNETALEMDVALELTSAPDAPAVFLTLAPGQTQRFTDIVAQAFGLDGRLSPLRVTTAGRRAITVRARAYAVRAGELSPAQPIDVYSLDTWHPMRVLDGLGFADDLRTNIGLVNLSNQDADFILGLQRVPGRNIAQTVIRVAAGSIVHMSIQSLFPLISKGYGFAVVVETPVRDTHVYASVIENATNGAKFIAPRVGTR
jgi:hypothetical protein